MKSLGRALAAAVALVAVCGASLTAVAPASAAAAAVVPKVSVSPKVSVTALAPSVPQSATASAGVKVITVTWRAPASNGGAPITAYELSYSTDPTFSAARTTVLTLGGTSLGSQLTDLADATTYYYRVRAYNDTDYSPWTAARSAKTARTPGPPGPGKGTTGLNSVSYKWKVTTTTGGSPITGFRIQYSTDPTFLTGTKVLETATPAVLVANIAGLAPSTVYYLRAAAVNAVGVGRYNVPVSAKTADTPVAPLSPVVTAAARGTLNVRWTAPSTGGAPITSYAMEYSSDQQFSETTTVTVPSTVTTSRIAGLSDASKYYVRLKAINAVGPSLSSPQVVARTYTTPDTPTITVTSGPKSFTGVISAAQFSGLPLSTSYRVEYSTDPNMVDGVVGLEVAGPTVTTTAALSNSTTYYVRVAARNTLGLSPFSPVVQTTTPGPPAQPADLTASGAAGSFTASWSAPTDGGSPITGYRVEYATNAQFTLPIVATVPAGTLTYTTPATLTPGATYWVRVSALNATGAGPLSLTASARTFGLPDVPANIRISGQSAASISIQWAPPANNGGTFITGYTVQYARNAGFTTDAVSVPVTADTNGYTAVNLVEGGTYWFRVSATTIVGTSFWTTTTISGIAAVPTTVPQAPAAPTLTLADPSTITATWAAPADNGSPITSYQVQYDDDPAFPSPTQSAVTIPLTTLSDLADGTRYYVRTAAVNAAGTGPWSPIATLALATAPDAPTAVTAIDSPTQLSVSWQAPDDNGYPITGYRVQYAKTNAFTTGLTTFDVTDTSATLPGLATGSTYYVRVAAINLAGAGAFSPVVTTVLATVPAAPVRIVSGTVEIAAVPVTVTAGATNGAPITGYTIQYSTDPTFDTNLTTITSPTSATKISGLTPSTKYYLRAAATNAVGTGPFTNATNATTTAADPAATPPSAPAAPSVAVASATSLSLSWTAAADNGSPINRYTVRYSIYPDFATFATMDTSTTTATLVGLSTGATFYVQVAGVNAGGTGAFSDATSHLLAVAPAAPSTPLISVVDPTSFTVLWSAPAENGAPITAYTISYATDAAFTAGLGTVSAEASPATITGLTPGSTYWVKVSATNSAGTSLTSSAASKLAATLPDAPAAPTLTAATTTSMNVAWVAPAPNGSPIAGYRVQYSTDPTFAAPLALAPTTNVAVLSRLTTGATYYVRVAAINGVGQSPWSAAQPRTAALAPLAPAAPAVTVASTSSLTVSWSAPATNGTAVTGYELAYDTDPAFPDPTTVATAGTRTTLTGLSNGATYYLKVQATSAEGASPYSTATSKLLATAPAAGSGPSATVASTTSMVLTWTAPDANGSPVTGYRIQYTTDPLFLTGIVVIDTTTAALSRTLTGLATGSTYYLRVAASNAIGVGPFSSTTTKSLTSTPTAPAAPTVTVASTSSLNVSWSAPADGGSPITGYSVTYATTPTFTVPSTVTVTGATSTTLTGLQVGSTYYVKVVATNTNGNGSYSAPTTTLLATGPAQPAAPTLTTVSTSSVNVSWTAPAANGSPITGYRVEYATDAGFTVPDAVDISAPATTTTLIDLTPGAAYFVRVYAINDAGASPASATATSSTALAPDAPNAPSLVAASATSVTVSWPAALANGSAVTGYTIEYATNTQFTGATSRTLTASATSASLTGLTTGSTYYVRLRATSSAGSSPWSPVSSRLVATAPAAPSITDVTVTGLPASTSVAWTAPAANGSTITGYRLQYSTSATFAAGVTTTDLGTPATTTVQSLTPGSTYYLRVAAINAVGVSTWSPTANKLIAVAPSAPAAPAVTLLSTTSMQVTWVAPAANGTPITGYTVQYATDAAFTDAASANAAALTTTLTGLSTGVTYYVRVTATNAAGTSAASATTSTSLSTPPSAPAAPTVTVTSPTSLDISWTAPAANGSAITGYTLTYATNSGFTANVATATPTGTSTTLTGLTTGSTYWVKVSATNAAGSSAASSSASKLLATAPAAPAAPTLTASALGTSIAATWTAPATNGSAITGYTVEYSTSSDFTGAQSASSASANATLSNLTSGGTYYVRVYATNAVGTSTASSSTSVSTPLVTAPDAPQTPTVTVASTTSLALAWTAPADGGSPITGYTITYATNSGFTANVVTTTSTGVSKTLTGLTTGSTYYVKVSATNAAGSSPASLAASRLLATAPGTPTAPTLVTASTTSLAVSWTAPATNGSAITGYTVEYATTSNFADATTVTATGVSTTLTDLASGGTYYVRVSATNAVGTSAASAAASKALASAPATPNAPTVAVASATSLTVSWTAPADNGDPISSYTVTYYTDPSAPATALVTGATSTTLTGLTTGSTYSVTVAATNSAGTSSASSVTSKLLATMPGTPTTPTLSPASISTMDVSWTAPASNGSTITGYTLTYATNSAFTTNLATTTAAGTSTTLTGLSLGSTYWVKVTATNAVGTSAASSATSKLLALAPAAPAAPVAAIVTTPSRSHTITWTAPSSRGSSITGYTVTRIGTNLATGVVGAETTVATLGNVLTASDTDLTPGVSYIYKVAATNATGTGAQSPGSNAVTVPDVPAAPTSVTASPSPVRTANLTWTAPTYTGGSTLTGYVVQAYAAGQSTPEATSTVSGTTATITGLTSGTTYTFKVFTLSVEYPALIGSPGSYVQTPGTSSPMAMLTIPEVPPLTVAYCTSDITACGATAITSTKSAFYATWTAGDTGGSSITNYTLERGVVSGGSTTWTTIYTASTLGGSKADLNLTPGTVYSYRISATNAQGTATSTVQTFTGCGLPASTTMTTVATTTISASASTTDASALTINGFPANPTNGNYCAIDKFRVEIDYVYVSTTTVGSKTITVSADGAGAYPTSQTISGWSSADFGGTIDPYSNASSAGFKFARVYAHTPAGWATTATKYTIQTPFVLGGGVSISAPTALSTTRTANTLTINATVTPGALNGKTLSYYEFAYTPVANATCSATTPVPCTYTNSSPSYTVTGALIGAVNGSTVTRVLPTTNRASTEQSFSMPSFPEAVNVWIWVRAVDTQGMASPWIRVQQTLAPAPGLVTGTGYSPARGALSWAAPGTNIAGQSIAGYDVTVYQSLDSGVTYTDITSTLTTVMSDSVTDPIRWIGGFENKAQTLIFDIRSKNASGQMSAPVRSINTYANMGASTTMPAITFATATGSSAIKATGITVYGDGLYQLQYSTSNAGGQSGYTTAPGIYVHKQAPGASLPLSYATFTVPSPSTLYYVHVRCFQYSGWTNVWSPDASTTSTG